ncbi:hypothetical protein [Paludisphaera borealis]|uniref:Uncharacterized protein n=1 Tax=Paludisphaera borealis TaxID=1387353 RepID=A0A1U7CS25_9BACT|nr:hypothetical protein [Paludisphaera borealis]APW61750.1 hypothetical protein BSF38_03278 [Paludisphaera borealis]
MGPQMHAPARPQRARRSLLRRLYTSNPFYVISADLVFIGLRMSFDTSGRTFETGAFMIALLGYTLLLATTACVLMRLGEVWDDVRTILLLVVAMFLAISVTFDETLARNPRLGVLFYVGGLSFAVAVSEGMLRGVRLRLPAGFRVPYYLILAVFFLYPVALTPLLADADDPRLQWMLFGFSTAAAVAFASLIPAIRRGPEYVADNGSPWRYPLYPWVLFGLLALAVCGRAYYLCISLHFVDRSYNVGNSDNIFGPYFLVPFLLVLDVLVLEAGLVSRNGKTQRAAIFALPGIVALAAIGGRPDPIYRGFLAMFEQGMHGTPVDLALVGAMAFCGYAARRRVPLALGGLTASLFALAVADPGAWASGRLEAVRPIPLLAASALEFVLAWRRRESLRALIGAAGLIAVVAIGLDRAGWGSFVQGVVVFHLVIASFMAIGVLFDDDELARHLRQVGGLGLGLACIVASWSDPAAFARFHAPAGWIALYPFVVVVVLVVYGVLTRDRLYPAVGMAGLASWIGGAGWRTYIELRRSIVGLDWISWGLAFFFAAAAISLRKSGVLDRRRRSATIKDVDPTWTRLD